MRTVICKKEDESIFLSVSGEKKTHSCEILSHWWAKAIAHVWVCKGEDPVFERVSSILCWYFAYLEIDWIIRIILKIPEKRLIT